MRTNYWPSSCISVSGACELPKLSSILCDFYNRLIVVTGQMPDVVINMPLDQLMRVHEALNLSALTLQFSPEDFKYCNIQFKMAERKPAPMRMHDTDWKLTG